MKSERIAETINNEMELIIHNDTNNEMCTPESVKQSDLMKNNNEWLSLKFNNNGYCLDETVQEENDNTIYYFGMLTSYFFTKKMLHIFKFILN